MNPFGLDIGNSTIKAIHLEKKGEQFALLAAGITGTPGMGMDTQNEKDLNTVAEAIKKLVADTKIVSKDVNISLPESKVFTRLIQLPLLSDEEVAAAISWQAEPYIPIPVAQASIDYQIVNRRQAQGSDPGGVDVLLVASSRDLIGKYIKVVTLAGLNVVNIESDLIALTRAIAPPNYTTILVDVGSSSTNIGIVKSGQILVSRSVATGGTVLTRAVATSLSVTPQQAEEYKKTYGLNAQALEGKVKQAIEPAFKLIVEEIKKTIQYYKTDIGKNDQVTLATITGGTAGLADIIPYLSQELGLEVSVGDPFGKIIKDEKTTKALASWSPLYSVAVGLAQNF